MDTFKFYVFVLTYITLIFVQNNVDAAIGDTCGDPTPICESSNNEICEGTTCVCNSGYYESGTLCSSISILKPTGLTSSSQTSTSVTLDWTSPNVPGYTSSYVVNYNEEGGATQTHIVNSQDVFTTVTGLSSGTTYTFTVTKTIEKDGRAQTVPISDPIDQATSSTPTVKVYGDICTEGSTNECPAGLACVSPVNKCLCADGFYYTGATCTSNNALKPIGLVNTKTSNSVTLSWTSPAASGYTNSHVINYIVQGGAVQTHAVNGEDVTTLIPSLNPGTTYTFTVVRSITREGRTQNVLSASDPYPVTTVGVYSDSCTAVGDSTECGSGLICVSGTGSMCLCQNGNYYNGAICTSTNALKPSVNSNAQTLNSVTLSWTVSDAPGYTNSYVINYSVQGGSNTQTLNLNTQDQFTTVPDLNPGTTYNFIVVRSIARYGRTQAVLSDALAVSTTKLDYGSVCIGDQCRSILSCIAAKCLCAAGNYYTADSCISTSYLKPSISNPQPTSTSSVTINWNSPPAPGYANSYVIKYTEKDTAVQETTLSLGDASTHIVTGLKAGTSYTFIVVRSITREGRTQFIDSNGSEGTSEKINYGESCVSNGTCKESVTDCYSSSCRCDPGYFRKDTTCFPNANLSPGNVNTERLSTTQLRVTWTVSAYTEVVTGYLVELSPSVASENIDITGTSATISSLTPGENYTIIVKSRSGYLNRGETAPANAVTGITKPAQTAGLAPATSLMEPEAKIYFYKAEGLADSYTLTLTGNGYNMMKTASGSGDTLSADFPGVSAGLYYDITIITISFGVSSDPFTTRERVRAEASDPVVDLSVFGVTSRSASMKWKRPVNTKGVLYKYGIEVFNASTCLQRINIQCTECNIPTNVNESSETSCGNEKTVMISQSDLNNVNFPVLYDVSLLPSTLYEVVVAAYNEEGKGLTDQEPVQTEQEAPGDPTDFRFVSKTSESVELTWTPPEPRPGVTTYLIRVDEWDEARGQYVSFRNTSNLGFYDVVNNITGLSSYWKYKFEMHAKTSKGLSNTSYVPEVTTEESAPIAVENLQHQPVDGVYNQYQLSWRCPPQKDGRNGVITSATIIKSSFTQSVDINPAIGDKQFVNTDCTWSEKVTVTPEFNYTFEVYISNSIKGESTTIQQYMPPGAASLSSTSVPAGQQETSSELQTIQFLCCPSCILDPKNGRLTSHGIIVCKGSCNRNRRKRQVRTAADYDVMKTWSQSQKNGFSYPYRTTPAGWLASVKDANNIKYIIGNDTKCSQKSETTFCNGPLEEATSYIVIVFACTAAGCDESEEVTISTAKTPSNIGGIVGGVVGALFFFVLVIVIIVVRRRGARPTTIKRRLEEPSDDEELIVKKRPVQINNFEKRVEEMHKDSNLLFSEEFEDINALSPKEKCVASETDGNKLKNRYVNILPFDATRVKLRQTEEDDGETDYINANYIPGYSSPREYIATQGPMTGTINDFWRMIWEQNVPIIIMLSDLSEKGKPKVDRYYPENMESVQYGDIVLEMTNFSPLNKYVIRIFKLQVGEEVRMVRHYFLPGWQDFGANLNSDDVIDFVKNVRREIKPNNTGPVCVHCSAGVGRTGTYIALDVFQQYIDEENMDKEMDIFDFVMKMRGNRSYMVQTEKQYIFIHDTIKEMIVKKKKEIAERDNIYMNNEIKGEELYVNQAFEADTQDIYMNVDTSSGKPTTVL